MKKLWIVLLSVAMVMAFTMPAAAVDVKFSGSYYVEGVYRNNPSLREDSVGNAGATDASKALYFQRLRIQTEFKVVEGLKLVTRFDALEKRWGDQSWNQASGQGKDPYDVSNRFSNGNPNVRAQENIEFEQAYVDFNTGIGRFLVGYQIFGAFGTQFFDTSAVNPGMKWFYPVGPVTIVAAYSKQKEKEVMVDNTDYAAGKYSDLDKDLYDLGVTYKQGNIEAGLLIEYMRDAAGRTGAGIPAANVYPAFTTTGYIFDPYFKGKFGNLFVEAEFIYAAGKLMEFENAAAAGALGSTDVDFAAYGAYLHGRYDAGMFYGGLIFAMASGDDPSTPDKVEGNLASSTAFQKGQDWSPTLILKNDAHNTYVGSNTGYATATHPATAFGASNSQGRFMDNIWFYQAYFGVKPMPKLDIVAKISYAYADEKPWGTPATLSIANSTGTSSTEFKNSDYGTEVDLIATYKIYDNLQYEVGFGYFFTGDYFKGTSDANKIDNDYLLMHKLTLTF